MFGNMSREYLPVVLGKEALGDLADTTTTYSPSQNPTMLNEFSTVAFRYCIMIFIFQRIGPWPILSYSRDVRLCVCMSLFMQFFSRPLIGPQIT